MEVPAPKAILEDGGGAQDCCLARCNPGAARRCAGAPPAPFVSQEAAPVVPPPSTTRWAPDFHQPPGHAPAPDFLHPRWSGFRSRGAPSGTLRPGPASDKVRVRYSRNKAPRYGGLASTALRASIRAESPESRLPRPSTRSSSSLRRRSWARSVRRAAR